MGKLDPYRIREDFPILKRRIGDKPLVYLDNAASTLKPIQVIEAIASFYKEHYSNVFRGVYTLSREATELYEEAREVIAKFVNARSSSEIVFTYNATEALNMVAYGLGMEVVEEGDEIVTTVMEHNSNLLPWMHVAKVKKARLVIVDINDGGELNYEQLSKVISERTKVVTITHASNVLGTVNDLKTIVKIAHEVGAVVVVDGAQSVPHMKVDVRDLGIDFLAFSGHKMLGPTGIGVLWGRLEFLQEMKPFKLGGGTVKEVTTCSITYEDPPRRFEAGTPNVAGAVGLMEAARYLMRLGMEEVHRHEVELLRYTLKLFEEDLHDYIMIYGPRDPEKRCGIITFNLRGLDSYTVGKMLDEYGIAVRVGTHCAHLLHQRLGVEGTVRVSYYIYNTKEEVEYLAESLHDIVGNHCSARYC
ncbi:MAG: cysteine desulfurase [Thermoprotei archaeon]|nr:MAG: cysteine desulfurase [Thermoprotei archaeon]